MEGVYLLNYSVNGIKSLDREVNLSFYKKTISRTIDFSNYRVKGIYGMNGSGKSAIISSIEVLKNVLMNEEYLNNTINQNKLKGLINKNTHKCTISAEVAMNLPEMAKLEIVKYELVIAEGLNGIINIVGEKLSLKNSIRSGEDYTDYVLIENGAVKALNIEQEPLKDEFLDSSKNLLSKISCCILFVKLIASKNNADEIAKWGTEHIIAPLTALYALAVSLSVYLEAEDEHTNYVLSNLLYEEYRSKKNAPNLAALLEESYFSNKYKKVLELGKTFVTKDNLKDYKESIRQLEEFLKVFKTNLKGIRIDKKPDKEGYWCDLILVYDNYEINPEFESTGIKKLIRMFVNLRDMFNGGIVFIDEIDSNIHDVYLCAIIEFLAQYGKGQLCFTSHNIGPMDILKTRKKSIDFLSEDHRIIPWTSNGNYSPASLYKKGMVEGSPFNIEAIDFMGVFDI